MKNKGLGCVIFFLVFLLLVSVAVNFLQFAAHFGLVEQAAGEVEQPPKFREIMEQKGAAESKDKIVRLDLEGIIASGPAEDLFGGGGMDLESIKRALRQATEDKTVKAIVLRIDSPGGEVTASDTLYHAVKEAAKKMPVVVYMDSLAASGGYYVSCGATRIVANETTLTGSIGVIIQSLNYSGTFGKIGMDTMTFVSGTFKDTLGGARAMRDDEKIYVQGLVMKMYERFLGIVSEARRIDKETLKSGIADGRIFTGGEALQNRLVDQVGYIEEAYAAARDLGHAPNASVVRYRHHGALRDLLDLFGSAQDAKGRVKIDLSDRLIPRLQPGKMYLLPAHMAP
jgi:protease-4